MVQLLSPPLCLGSGCLAFFLPAQTWLYGPQGLSHLVTQTRNYTENHFLTCHSSGTSSNPTSKQGLNPLPYNTLLALRTQLVPPKHSSRPSPHPRGNPSSHHPPGPGPSLSTFITRVDAFCNE